MGRLRFIVLIAVALLLQGCAISYKFNGASIDYSNTKSIAIAEFPNQAALVYPQLSSMLSETIRDIYSRQTRLEVTRRNGDLELEGEITGYTLTAMAIAADSYAAETKLTITVRVRFTNNNAPEENFEKTYTAYRSEMVITRYEELINRSSDIKKVVFFRFFLHISKKSSTFAG